jgi:hypothetical protein
VAADGAPRARRDPRIAELAVSTAGRQSWRATCAWLSGVLCDVAAGGVGSYPVAMHASVRLVLPDGRTLMLGHGAERATLQVNDERVFQRVLADYGDDSVAQLGGAHVAIEGVSNVLTKVIEWGRLASYLEQSTRYVPYDTQVDGRWKYVRPAGVAAHPELLAEYERVLDDVFATYARLNTVVFDHLMTTEAPATDDPAAMRALRARALDAVRGLLPAATTSPGLRRR